jgi:hypothetical protein
MLAKFTHTLRKMKRLIGYGILINAESDTSYRDLISPQSCYIDPRNRSIKKKLPVLKAFKAYVAFSIVFYTLSDPSLLEIMGGRVPPMYIYPSTIFRLLICYPVLLMNMDTSFTTTLNDP